MRSTQASRSLANQINPKCTLCPCHVSARTVCLKGKVAPRSRLVVFTDSPDYFADNAGRPYALDTGKILDWMFARMSVPSKDVSYEYTIRCYGKDTLPTTKAGRAQCIEECAQYRFATIAKIKPKAIAVLGQVSFEAFTGAGKVGEHEGRRLRAWEPVVRDFVDGVWCGYSLAYILISPSDAYRVFRVLYKAAEEAGLNPELDPSVPPFVWRNLK